MTGTVEKVKRKLSRPRDLDRAAEHAVEQTPLSAYAVARLRAPDAPRFKPELDRLFPRV